MSEPRLRAKGFDGEWWQKSLGAAATIKSGEFISGARYAEYGDVPFFNGGASSSGVCEKANSDGNNVLISSRGSVGSVNLPRQECWVGGSCYEMKFKTEDTDFMYQLLQADKAHLLDMVQMTNIPALLKSDIERFEFLSPAIKEQQSIGETLKTMDEMIDNARKELERLKQVKKASLSVMFPQEGETKPRLRFKGFTDDWEQRKFCDAFDGLQNNTLSRADLNYESGTVKNVHYGDVLIKFGDYIDVSETELPYISDDEKAEKLKSSFLRDGDIVIADTAEDDTVGKCTEIQGSEGLQLLAGLHTIPCRPKEKYGAKFLGYYLNSPSYHNQLRPLMQGIKVTSVSKTALSGTDLLMPISVDEQKKIGDYFSSLDHLITLHQRELEKLECVKSALLSRMFPINGW